MSFRRDATAASCSWSLSVRCTVRRSCSRACWSGSSALTATVTPDRNGGPMPAIRLRRCGPRSASCRARAERHPHHGAYRARAGAPIGRWRARRPPPRDQRGPGPPRRPYADVDGNWTDTEVNPAVDAPSTEPECAGDGKFDQERMPRARACRGRIDLSDLPALGRSEAQLTATTGTFGAVPARTAPPPSEGLYARQLWFGSGRPPQPSDAG